MDFETFLLDNGYDTTLKGGVTFCFLLEEVLYLMNKGMSDKKIKKELNDIYRSYMFRFFRTDGNKFFTEMIVFLKSKSKRKNAKVGKIDDALIKLARMYRVESGLEKESMPKVKVKNR